MSQNIIRALKKLGRNEQGNVMVLYAVSMVFILGMVGLVVDIGMVYKAKSDLKKEAATAALSGAQELTNGDPARVQTVVNSILSSYQDQASLQTIETSLNQQVRVTLKKAVPLAFARVLGWNSITVQVSSTAKLYPISGLVGVIPLGVDESTPITYGQTVSLKVGAGDSSTGNFGILALAGPGAKTYDDTLKYGFDQALNVGAIVNTQTGNIAGATQDGVNYRINQCPNPNGDMTIRDCARILPVVVYKPYGSTTNLTQIMVTGFAYFYLLQPMSANDTAVIGTFIKRVDTGTYGTGSIDDRGAYMARLVE